MTGVTTALAVALGTAAGSMVRYGAEVLQTRHRDRRGVVLTGRELPVSTLVVNVVGSAVLGLVIGLGDSGDLGPWAVAVLGAGLAGGLTTFSTFALEIVTLARARAWRTATGYAAATLVLGVAAAALTYRAALPSG